MNRYRYTLLATALLISSLAFAMDNDNNDHNSAHDFMRLMPPMHMSMNDYKELAGDTNSVRCKEQEIKELTQRIRQHPAYIKMSEDPEANSQTIQAMKSDAKTGICSHAASACETLPVSETYWAIFFGAKTIHDICNDKPKAVCFYYITRLFCFAAYEKLLAREKEIYGVGQALHRTKTMLTCLKELGQKKTTGCDMKHSKVD